MSNKLISSFYFFEHGKEIIKSKKFNFKTTGKIANSSTIVGLTKYQIDKHGIENKNDIEGYVGYMMRELGDEFKRNPIAITNYGKLNLSDENDIAKYNELSKNMSSAFSKDGNLAWCPIISFDGFEIAKDMYMLSDDDYLAVISKSLPAWFKKVGLEPSNMLWTASYHNNTDNPHVHFLFMEKQQTRTKGSFKIKEINDFRLELVKAINQRTRVLNKAENNIENIKNQHFKLDENKIILKQGVSDFLSNKVDKIIQKEIIELYKRIDKDKPSGKLMINSYSMKNYREDIYKMVDNILNHPTNKEKYEMFKKELISLDIQTKGNLVENPNSYLNSETIKLKQWIANQILKDKKNYDLNRQNKISFNLDENVSVNYNETEEKIKKIIDVKVKKQVSKIYKKQQESFKSGNKFKSNIVSKASKKLSFNLSTLGKTTQKQLDKHYQEMEEKTYAKDINFNRS